MLFIIKLEFSKCVSGIENREKYDHFMEFKTIFQYVIKIKKSEMDKTVLDQINK